MTLPSLIQNSKMQYQKQNRLRNPPTQYSIYYMNHNMYIANHTTLDHSDWNFEARYTPHLRLGIYLLQTSSDLSLG